MKFREALRLLRTEAGTNELRTRLCAAFDELSEDERALLVLITERAVAGARAYGDLKVEDDLRDFTHEAVEELADAVFYLGAQTLRMSRGKTQ